MSRIFDALKSAVETRKSTDRAKWLDAGKLMTFDAPANDGSADAAMNSACAADAPVARVERRQQKRAGIKLAARVRPSNLSDGHFQEITTTVNASRKGFYFTTARKEYHPSMPLHIAFPYNSAHDTVTTSEDSAEVTRVEELPDGQLGIAVALRNRTCTPRPVSSVTQGSSRPHKERRHATRYPFPATATVTELHSQTRLQARCSDLSLEGCYVDILNPFSEGTYLHLQICKEQETFEAFVRVTTSSVGMGMGLFFQELAPEQASFLHKWLNLEPAERKELSF